MFNNRDEIVLYINNKNVYVIFIFIIKFANLFLQIN